MAMTKSLAAVGPSVSVSESVDRPAVYSHLNTSALSIDNP